MKHTKGEWRIHDTGNTIDIDSDDDEICFMNCHSYEDEEVEANAKLIAAAPDLLENLTRIIDRIEEAGLQNQMPSAYQRALKAIEKATI